MAKSCKDFKTLFVKKDGGRRDGKKRNDRKRNDRRLEVTRDAGQR